jgi:osmotically-inducible protein OsmY
MVLAISGCSVIRGDKTAGTALDDTKIEARIKAAMAADPAVAASRFDVNVDHGRVTLVGTAKTPQEAQRAREIAAEVPGVKKVESHIHVAQASSTSDSPAPR